MGNYSPRGGITQFSQQEVVQADPEIAISTGWNSIDKTNWDVTEQGSATVDPTTGGLYALNVTDADGDLAALQTVDRVEYVPSMAAFWGMAFLADSLITEDQEFRAGITNTETWDDAYQYRIIGTPAGEENDHYLVIRKTGSDSIVRHWDGWPSDPRQHGWDETVGMILRNEVGWYDLGEWKPEAQIPDLQTGDNTIIDLQENPDPSVRKMVVPLDYLSAVSETATDNINFRIRFELKNTGANASANRMQVGNPHYNILGQNEPNPRFKDVERNGGSIGSGNITTTQPYPLVAIRNNGQDVKMVLQSVVSTPVADSVEVTAYMMRKEDVTFSTGPDTDFGPAPGTDKRETFFEDTDWNGIASVTRFDAPGTGNNDPHVGTEGYPVGRKVAGRTVQGSDQNKVAGASNSLDANTQLTDLDYLVIFARATETDNISLQALDYEMAVDR
ncbi:hypothetical protein HHTV1_10 [Haloarcula hispanica tailed virus 1]|uniref:Uncharacterized protein n=1 Tax=Haloarcula hispanica tailed virus 1 TaxID=1273750 RepID=R4TGA6_9CAUD|nr:hypothetical protein M198_gp10 [Haloarcula hispanica tailed virus 1]AGM11266.1 hypothetical protein HHTV1_10 [Haloarcula hispanica tailed virus 1]